LNNDEEVEAVEVDQFEGEGEGETIGPSTMKRQIAIANHLTRLVPTSISLKPLSMKAASWASKPLTVVSLTWIDWEGG
jgi:hypothetical protein